MNCVALAVYTPYPNKDNDKTNSLLVSYISCTYSQSFSTLSSKFVFRNLL